MKAIFSIFLLFVTQMALGQVSSPVVTLQYDMTVESYYTIESGASIESLSLVDRVLTQMKTEITHTMISIDSTGTHSTTIDLINTTDYFKDWPIKPARFIFDQNGYRILNQSGGLIVDVPNDSLGLAEFNQMKSMLANSGMQPMISIPAAPNAQQTAQLQNLGISVEFLDAGKYRITNGQSTTFFDPLNLRLIQTEKEGTIIVSTTIKEYQLATNGNYLVPSIERVVESVNRPSGACMQSVVKRRYQNYRMEEPAGPRTGSPEHSTDLASIYPNPAQSEITVAFSNQSDSSAEITVHDFQGRLMFEKQIFSPSGTEKIDMADWPPGFYVVSVFTGQNRQFMKLLKTVE